jgi:hypothetical protein
MPTIAIRSVLNLIPPILDDHSARIGAAEYAAAFRDH